MFWRNIAEFLRPAPRNPESGDVASDSIELQDGEGRSRKKMNIRDKLFGSGPSTPPAEPEY